MTTRSPWMAATACAALALTAALPAVAQTVASHPWDNPKLSPDRRADLLAAQLTPDEAQSLLHGHFPTLMKDRPADVPRSAGWFPGVPRLGVPALRESDASLGVATARRPPEAVTALPSGLALAAGWDGALAYQAGATIGEETHRKGFNILLAGGINLVRDPRNGRNFEYVGEDPLLASVIAGESIRGIQSRGVASTIKHFALNGQETGRMVLDARIGEAALRESDLLAFQLAIERGRPASVMCAYNKINGLYACENGPLLAALKHDWSWPGWVMSDWGAVHSTEAAVLAGLDQESGQELDAKVFFDAPLQAAVASGAVPKARYADMLHRILRSLFAAGVMDRPYALEPVDVAAGRAAAQKAAERGMVLLKNDGGLLPVARSAKRIVLVGGHADVGVLSGGGSSQVIPVGSLVVKATKGAPTWTEGAVYHPAPPLPAIRARAAGAEVVYDDGSDPARAAALAKGADLVVVFGEQWTSEAYDAPLSLTEGQDALISAVAKANPKTVVVLETGGPVLMPWLGEVGAVLEAWYPGSAGGEAIARVMFGEAEPAGRLPVTFPASEAQLPRPALPGADILRANPKLADTKLPGFPVDYVEGADVGYRWFARKGQKPLFPFGFGLGYTTFRYDALKVSGGGRNLKISLRVTNTGARAGQATPQVYAAPPGGMARLVGWSQLSLAPGESRTVEVKSEPRLLAAYDVTRRRFEMAGGRYAVFAGGNAADRAATGMVTLQPDGL